MNESQNRHLTGSVEIRDLREADYGDLEDIISDTWEFEAFCSPKTAKNLAALYLQSCLCRKTFAKVAVIKGRAAGVLVGKAGKPKSSFMPMVKALLRTCSTKEGRRVCRMFQKFDRIDSVLLKQSGKQFDGELVFFALARQARGLGIGLMLWEELEEHFRSASAKEIYVYTDSTCSYGFYEHQGFGRIGAYHYQVPEMPQSKAIDFYLYEKLIPE